MPGGRQSRQTSSPSPGDLYACVEGSLLNNEVLNERLYRIVRGDTLLCQAILTDTCLESSDADIIDYCFLGVPLAYILACQEEWASSRGVAFTLCLLFSSRRRFTSNRRIYMP